MLVPSLSKFHSLIANKTLLAEVFKFLCPSPSFLFFVRIRVSLLSSFSEGGCNDCEGKAVNQSAMEVG